MRIKLLQVRDCPTSPIAIKLLRKILDEEGISDPIEVVEVPDPEAARRERFLGSPTIQIDGFDIEKERRGNPTSYGCRIYQTEKGASGVPSEEMIRDALRQARVQKMKILYLCTGNSCRSQMAEGWTRLLKGDVIEPFSAGIETHGINPFAVKVMAEAGVNISQQRSKLVDEFIDNEFDYVITLCDHAKGNCPFFPGKTKEFHMGFDDPHKLAENTKNEDEALSHYRRVRNEIREFVEKLPEILLNT